MNPRTSAIEERLVRFFETELNCETTVVGPLQWACRGRFSFGYMPPITDDPPRVFVSPALIGAVTASLSDADLDYYLTTIEILIGMHLMFPMATPDKVTNRAEESMMAVAPDLMKMVAETEMRAIDDGIVVCA